MQESTAAWVVAQAPSEWQTILETVCDLAEQKGADILPPIDHGRVQKFVKFWEKQKTIPAWLRQVCQRLKLLYC